jgi:membrane protein DedA with SNARE-associated domain
MNVAELIQSFFISLKSGQLPQLGIWTYFLLAALVAVEGPVATLLGAAAASAGLMRPGWVFVAAAAGNLSADSFWYMLGYLGKIELLVRFGQRLGIRPDLLERLQKGMQDHAARILFVAKLTLSFIIPSLISAGLMKVPWRRWFPAVFGGEMFWTGALVLIGFYATEVIKSAEKGVEYLAAGGGILFVLFLLFMGRRLLQKQVHGTDLVQEK